MMSDNHITVDDTLKSLSFFDLKRLEVKVSGEGGDTRMIEAEINRRIEGNAPGKNPFAE